MRESGASHFPNLGFPRDPSGGARWHGSGTKHCLLHTEPPMALAVEHGWQGPGRSSSNSQNTHAHARSKWLFSLSCLPIPLPMGSEEMALLKLCRVIDRSSCSLPGLQLAKEKTLSTPVPRKTCQLTQRWESSWFIREPQARVRICASLSSFGEVISQGTGLNFLLQILSWPTRLPSLRIYMRRKWKLVQNQAVAPIPPVAEEPQWGQSAATVPRDGSVNSWTSRHCRLPIWILEPKSSWFVFDRVAFEFLKYVLTGV